MDYLLGNVKYYVWGDLQKDRANQFDFMAIQRKNGPLVGSPNSDLSRKIKVRLFIDLLIATPGQNFRSFSDLFAILKWS